MIFSEVLQLLKSEGYEVAGEWNRAMLHAAIGNRYLGAKYPLGGAEDREYDDMDIRRAVVALRIWSLIGQLKSFRSTVLFDGLQDVATTHDIGLAYATAERKPTWALFADDIPHEAIHAEGAFLVIPCYVASLDSNKLDIDAVLEHHNTATVGEVGETTE